jgi:tetratricopeptide (TPR) repeat protein
VGAGKFNQAVSYSQKIVNIFDQGGTLGSGTIDFICQVRLSIGALYMRNGKLRKAREMFLQVKSILEEKNDWYLRFFRPWQRQVLFWLALWHLESGNIKKAELLVQEMRSLTPDELLTTFKKSYTRQVYLLLKGHLALYKKNMKAATKYLEQANDLLIGEYMLEPDFIIDAFVIYSLAQVYQIDGNVEQAIKTYEKISRLTRGRMDYGDLYTKSFLQLGKLYQKTGDKDKAIKNYQKFIELWKDCDPPLRPMVEDARKRLKDLIK